MNDAIAQMVTPRYVEVISENVAWVAELVYDDNGLLTVHDLCELVQSSVMHLIMIVMKILITDLMVRQILLVQISMVMLVL